MLDFVEDHVTESVPVTFCPIENTPFKLVEGVKELRELATKLQNVNEFAVSTCCSFQQGYCNVHMYMLSLHY